MRKRHPTQLIASSATVRSSMLNGRSKRGAAMAELPLALMILLLLLFFPSLDLLFLGIVYNAGAGLNDLQLRQAAVLRYQKAQDSSGPVRYTIPEAWKNSNLGKFAHVEGRIATTVSYSNGVVDDNGLQEKYVRVTTTMTVSPFISIPLPIRIPGLNSPTELKFSSERPMEDPTKAPQAVQ